MTRRAADPPVPLEHAEQVAVFQWFRDYACLRWTGLLLPDGRPGIFAVPNGGERDVRVASRLRAEGVSTGVPDLMIPALFLFVEMKRRKGSTTKDDQTTWHNYLRACGFEVVVALGADEAIAAITAAAKRKGWR